MICVPDHAETDLEVVTLPNDDPAQAPFIFRGMRYCTACHTIIIHVGEDVERIEIA